MSKLNDKDKAASFDNLKKAADKAKEQYSKDVITTADVLKSIAKVILAAAFSYVWALTMLLIISFVGLGYVHMNFDKMLVWSGFFAGFVTILVIIKEVRAILK